MHGAGGFINEIPASVREIIEQIGAKASFQEIVNNLDCKADFIAFR